MYITTNLTVYQPKNKACKELCDFVRPYEYIIISDDLSLDALIEEIRTKVNEINSKYPRIKPIKFGADNERINASVFTNGCPDYVFFLSYKKVRSVYQFAEQIKRKEIT